MEIFTKRAAVATVGLLSVFTTVIWAMPNAPKPKLAERHDSFDSRWADMPLELGSGVPFTELRVPNPVEAGPGKLRLPMVVKTHPAGKAAGCSDAPRLHAYCI
jgi:hypothetical protein